MNKILVVGSLNMDFVVNVSCRPQAGETVKGKSLSLIAGGKGANQAYALAKLGSEVIMLGAVGDDSFGQELVNNLHSVGVQTDYIVQKLGMETGKAFIEVEESGQNSIIIIGGANNALSVQDIIRHKAAFINVDAVVMQLEIPLDTVIAAADLAHALGKKVILDPAPARNDLPLELLEKVDIIKPNETELSTLTGMPTDTAEQVEEAAKKLLADGAKNVLVTLGEKGSMWFGHDGKVHAFPAVSAKAVDTTAAGDCFTAAFVSKLENRSISEAIAFAAKAAAISVTRRGAQSSIPSLQEVEGV